MNENKRTWDDKIMLALNELEGKINAESKERQNRDGKKSNTSGKKPNANRKKANRDGERLQAHGRKNRTKEEWKRAVFRQEILLHAVKSAAFLLATVALIQGVIRVLPSSITVSNSVNGRELPIYCVETEKPQIALSFDAAWGNEDTAKILEILKKHDVKVTFFMTGGWVESYPDDVKAILAAGHDLGNHSENHKHMPQLSAGDCEEELMAVHNKVLELTGYEMFLFRPPYGDYDNNVIKTAGKCGYYPIQWDVDSLDWKDYGVDSIIQTVTQHKHLGNGSIILCHNGAKYTAQALDSLITALEEKGYELVPISQLIYKDNYHLNHEGRQISGL